MQQPTGLRAQAPHGTHTATIQDDALARQLLHDTQERMYKWPTTFAGFQATLCVYEDDCVWHGEVTVRPHQPASVHLDAEPGRQAWVQEGFTTQAMHFTTRPFEAGDGRYTITFDPQESGSCQHPRGRRVLLHGGPLTSWYRISALRYNQIGRTAPDGSRRINTIERYDTAPDGRLYATHYVLAHFRAQGAPLAGLSSYVNEFVALQPDLLLPTRRTIWQVEGAVPSSRMLTLSAHRLLSEEPPIRP